MLRFISRLIIGIVFTFSGFVKAVDPVGGAIKIKDYLEAFHLSALEDLSLPLAILLSTFEFLIGFHLLVGIRVKLVAIPAFLFMLFFTGLTLVLAIANPVSDCGCFGDAIKLTNWQTFYKNLITLPFSFIIFHQRKNYKENLALWRSWLLTGLCCIFAVGLSIYSLDNLPLLDFRPFKVGTSILEDSKIPEGAPMPEYETIFILEKDGIKKEFDVNNYPYEDSTWVFVESKTNLIKEGYQPPILNFMLDTPEGENLTDNLLHHSQPVVLMITPKLEKANTTQIEEFKKIRNVCMEKGYPFYCVTASLPETIYAFDVKHEANFDYLSADETMLKTIIRSNPGLMVLKDGIIMAKYHYNHLPKPESFKNPVSNAFKQTNSHREKAYTGLYFIVLLLFTITLHTKSKNH
ncbi:DoxX family protein [Marinilabiliaceae bacterium JC017]|nr:DoxX family protein [Marinilabiliaceae bacterium JC017]